MIYLKEVWAFLLTAWDVTVRRIWRIGKTPFGAAFAVTFVVYRLVVPDNFWMLLIAWYFSAAMAGLILNISDAPYVEPPQE